MMAITHMGEDRNAKLGDSYKSSECVTPIYIRVERFDST